MNLIDHALKYSPAKSPVEIEVATPDPAIARVAVTDRGSGIRPEDRARVFERFLRAGPSDSVSGFGVGLSISRQIVELHGGRIDVEAPPGGGTRFVVTLPLLSTP